MDMDISSGSTMATHLCVLVHGLWGNPEHMKSIAKALRAAHSEDELYILNAKRNAGSFTYDGIELGAERVCVEIEEELESIRSRGGRITKLSIVGYSLGGLVARYVVGLLENKGLLDELEPMVGHFLHHTVILTIENWPADKTSNQTFTTFASPHLGVRSPLRGWYGHLWNTIGSRSLSASGKQLFTIDNFRGMDRPLLSVLADPNSVFMAGLKRFKRRILYTNITNDRTAVHYTTAIAKTDPYVDLTKIQPNFISGYGDVILDPDHPFTATVPEEKPATFQSTSMAYLRKAPLTLTITMLLPLGILLFVSAAITQTIRSSRRIQKHSQGLAGISIDRFRGPIWVKEIQGAVEEAYENINSHQQSYVSSDDDEEAMHGMGSGQKPSYPPQATLALAPHQFSMISNLDSIGWRKYPVWIRKVRHSHAAIIVRMDKPTFSEGHMVLKHWLQEEFLA